MGINRIAMRDSDSCRDQRRREDNRKAEAHTGSIARLGDPYSRPAYPLS